MWLSTRSCKTTSFEGSVSRNMKLNKVNTSEESDLNNQFDVRIYISKDIMQLRRGVSPMRLFLGLELYSSLV